MPPLAKIFTLPSSNSLRFTLQMKLILAFAIICALLLLLGQTARGVFFSNSRSVDKVLAINRAVKLADDGKINLAKAGQLPKLVELADAKLDKLTGQGADMRAQFRDIGAKLEGQITDEQEGRLTKEFITIGAEFYDGLDRLIPIRQKMLSYMAEYGGQVRSLPDIITERELGHITFIRTIKESIEKKKRITGGLDTTGCTFYQWYSQMKFEDEDITEVFEEIHPLHDKLHTYARQIDEKIEADDLDGAREIYATAEKDLKTLGLFFSGLRKLVEEKYKVQHDLFDKEASQIEEIYGRAEGAATALQTHLNDTVLQASLADMQSASAGSEKKMKVIVWFGLCLSVMIAAYAAFMMRRSVKILRLMTERLNDSAALFLTMSDQLLDNANRTQGLADNANRNIEQTSESISSLAASSEEINAAIYEISSNSVNSAGIAREATEESERASTVVGSLQQQADSIGAVTKMISNIAFQTKLLALNANVEAARAGEAGAGFAIVANEVKNLAQSAEEAANDIDQKVITIQTETKKTAEAMGNIGATIGKVCDNASSIAAAVEEESAVVGEISNRINEVAGLAQEVAQHIHEVSAAAHDTQEKSADLKEQADMLAETAEELSQLLVKL